MEKESRQLLSLIHSLNQPDKRALRQAVDALISTAPRFPHLARELECLLAEKPGTENWPVAYVLAHISSPSPLCLRVLGETLGATDPDIRWAVVLLLVRLAKQNARIVGLLFDLLKSGAPIQRRMALYCLRDTEADETAILQALLESLRDPDPLVRVAAVNSLKNRADRRGEQPQKSRRHRPRRPGSAPRRLSPGCRSQSAAHDCPSPGAPGGPHGRDSRRP
ncbi:MAG: HEAT repeat domain-containing protein [Deltaproteobacteria bacterium]|nr:HEAT repeat domain-containing protein [Deltaproteobacteria bacterium]